MIVLLCGLSGVGKTTLAGKAQSKLAEYGIQAEIIDGDEYRKTLCRDLGFCKADRLENIRRLGSVANKFSFKGIVSIVSAINPYEEIRHELKSIYKNVKIVYLDCPMHLLLERDTKGLYKKAHLPSGHPQKIENLTGVNDRFEIPDHPDLYINTGKKSIEQSSDELLRFIINEKTILQGSLRIQHTLQRPV